MASVQSSNSGIQATSVTNACPISDPRNWPLFKNVDDELLRKIKLFYVFGEHGQSALFTTSDNEVYGVGSNASCVLGIDAECTNVPEQLAELDGMCVRKFTSGDRHVLALAEDGRVFSWGDGVKGQLGIEYLNYSTAKQVDGALTGKVIVDVACGSEHSAAVTDSGALYVWGLNYSDEDGTPEIITEPKLVRLGQCPLVAQAVACSSHSTHVIADEGEVYSLGLNDYGQLGAYVTLKSTRHLEPLVFPGESEIVVMQMACGRSHCLAVTTDGQLYSWGRNHRGQLGKPNSARYRVGDPSRVVDIGRVAEVAAIHSSIDLSVARTIDGQIYVWGMGNASPTLTTFRSIQEAFSHYTLPSVTYQGMIAHHGQTKNGIVKSLGACFNDEETCDVKFKVDGKLLYAHRTILRMRCQYFRNMFHQHWKECSQDVIEIKGFSHAVYHTFLKYLYTDEIETTSVPELVRLMELANAMVDDELKYRCETLIKRATTVENAASVYSAGMKFSSPDLEKFSIHFAARNQAAVMKSGAFRGLVDDQLREFVAAVSELASN